MIGIIGSLLIDALLIAGFGVQHSVLATVAVKAKVTHRLRIDPLRWRSVQSFLNVAYILAAIALWQPVDNTVWRLSGVAAVLLGAICVGAWLWYFEIHIVEYDAGLAFGSSASASRMTNRKTPRLELWKVGSRNWLRLPVHTAFFPMFLGFPSMTAGTLLFGIGINVYNVIGFSPYDKRLERLGPTYKAYQRVTGLIFPRVTHPRGAVEIETAAPRHWEKPSIYVLPVLTGIASGCVYSFVLGNASASLVGLLEAAGLATAIALLSGLFIGLATNGRLAAGRNVDYTLLQARLSTSAALVSAVALIAWFAERYLVSGSIPYPGLVLPLWLIVLWLGHVAAYIGGYRASCPDAAAAASTHLEDRRELVLDALRHPTHEPPFGHGPLRRGARRMRRRPGAPSRTKTEQRAGLAIGLHAGRRLFAAAPRAEAVARPGDGESV